MILKIKQLVGSKYTADDKIEVQLEASNEAMHYVLFTVISVSGVPITHGGGADSGVYLYYTKDSDTYSNTFIEVVQTTQGVSIVKVMAQGVTTAVMDAYVTASEEYEARRLVGDEATWTEVPPSAPVPWEIETATVDLEWLDSVFK